MKINAQIFLMILTLLLAMSSSVLSQDDTVAVGIPLFRADTGDAGQGNQGDPGNAGDQGSDQGGQTTTDQTCAATDVGPKCKNCNVLMTCVGGVDVGNGQTCSSLVSNKPYCVTNNNRGECSATPPDGQTCASTDFTCTGDGQYPDPNDCNRYFICDGGTAIPYTCPPNFIYDSKSGLCRRWICQTVDCSKNLKQYVVHPTDPSVYIYCSSDGENVKPYVFRCPDPQNMRFDKSSLQCVYKCAGEGRFADKEDCTKFYECYWSQLVLQYYHRQCPSGFIYNADTKQCGRGTCPR